MGGEARRLRIRVRIKKCIADTNRAGPKSGAAHFVRVRLPHDFQRQPRRLVLKRRRTSAREASHCKIETAPEKMHRARLAHKAGAKVLEHSIDLDEHLPES